MSEDRDTTVIGRTLNDMETIELDFMLAVGLGAPPPQAPAIVRMHVEGGLAPIPYFYTFENVAGIGIDVDGAGTLRKKVR